MVKRGLLLATGLLLAVPGMAKMPQDAALGQANNWDVLLKLYPPRALAAREQGMVGFKVKLDRDGRALFCQVTHTSGYPRLDQETCDLVVLHAIFQPVKDTEGHKASPTSEGVVNWQIPTANGPMTPARPVAIASADAPEKKICKRTQVTGSLARYERTCMTAREWNRARDESTQLFDELQGRKGSTHGD